MINAEQYAFYLSTSSYSIVINEYKLQPYFTLPPITQISILPVSLLTNNFFFCIDTIYIQSVPMYIQVRSSFNLYSCIGAYI